MLEFNNIKIKEANGFIDRLIGLMFKKKLITDCFLNTAEAFIRFLCLPK